MAFDALATRGRDAAVECFGAGGGLRSPGTKSKIACSFWSTPFFWARARPSGRGIHVPSSVRLDVERSKTLTLIFAVAALDLLMHALLDLSLEDARADALLVLGGLEDMGRINPVVSPSPHNVDAGLGRELVHRDLVMFS